MSVALALDNARGRYRVPPAGGRAWIVAGGGSMRAEDEIAAFVRRRGLPAEDAEELLRLFADLTDVGESVVTASLHGVPSQIELDRDFPPSSADRYEDLGLLGVGGMGEVRRVRERELNRVLAMKVIRAELMSRPSVVSRFLEEAQVAAQLQHPGVAPIHELGRLPDGRLYFTMREVKGRSFTELIRDAHRHGLGDVDLRRLSDIFAKVCDAVAYAHSRGVLHRDLKPDNAMVGSFGEVLVIDWGLAKVLGRPSIVDGEAAEEEIRSVRDRDALRTHDGQIVGTAAYMAPEQAAGGDRVDARTDSLGS